jgi:hypothetical protein
LATGLRLPVYRLLRRDPIWRNHHQYFAVLRWPNESEIVVHASGYGHPEHLLIDRYVWDAQGVVRRLRRRTSRRIPATSDNGRAGDAMIRPGPHRAAKWLLATMGGAALATAADITMLWLHSSRDPNDLTYGRPLLFALLDPFVLTVAGPVAVLSGLAAYAVAYFWLDTTVMWRTVALIYTSVVTEIVIVGLRDPIEAWLLSYPVLVAAAVASKVLFGNTRSGFD